MPYQQYKTAAVPYFSILDRLKSQSYQILPFWTIQDTSRALFISYFSIFDNTKPQPYLVLATQIDQNPNRNLFLLFEQ